MVNIFPAIFIGHGSPLVGLDQKDSYYKTLNSFFRKFPKPKTILIISAHWETRSRIEITSGVQNSLIYDFYGFPEELYRMKFPTNGNPDLAKELQKTLHFTNYPSILNDHRGLDHGVWIPLSIMYPNIDIPVVQISLPTPRSPQWLMQLGKQLQYLREREILVIGSGNVVHNLQQTNYDKNAEVDLWAREFDSWIRIRLAEFDNSALLNYTTEAPYSSLAVPTSEHFDPLLVIFGTLLGNDEIVDIYQGFQHGNISMRCISLGSKIFYKDKVDINWSPIGGMVKNNSSI